MCNDYGNRVAYSALVEEFSELQIPVGFPQAAPNLEPRDDIRPMDIAPLICRVGQRNEFAQLRWGFPPPPGRKGGPVINLRSDGRHFPTGRCLVPASHFYEFTGVKSPKSKWEFTKAGEEWFCFAGIWRKTGEGIGAFSLLTAEPGPDVAPIHDRQVVVLERTDWRHWLDLSKSESELLIALPAGSLNVRQIR